MAQDWKTSVNNLIVVWQGSSWSVIAPDGYVLFRHWDKNTAILWAQQTHDYASNDFEPFNWEERKDEVVNSEKTRNRQYKTIADQKSANKKEASVSKKRVYRATLFEMIVEFLVMMAIEIPALIFWLLLLATVLIGLIFPRTDIGSFFISLIQQDITLLVLCVLLLFIPGGLIFASKRSEVWIGKLFRQPLTLIFGISGSVGTFLGSFLLVASFFREDLSTLRVIIIALIWVLLSYISYRISYELQD